MRRCQPLPDLWLMTDERTGDALWRALARLPRGAGVIFRHHATPPAERRLLYERVRRIARARRLVLILAGSPRAAIGWRADGWHGRTRYRGARGMIHTAPAHDRREVIAAGRRQAHAILLSPVFPTRSHPGAPVLGAVRFGSIARHARAPVIALGGMTRRRFARLKPFGAAGWAAIDALSQARPAGPVSG